MQRLKTGTGGRLRPLCEILRPRVDESCCRCPSPTSTRRNTAAARRRQRGSHFWTSTRFSGSPPITKGPIEIATSPADALGSPIPNGGNTPRPNYVIQRLCKIESCAQIHRLYWSCRSRDRCDSISGRKFRFKPLSCEPSRTAGTTHTQNQLYRALRSIYGSRVSHYCFNCTLSGRRAQEESQRTRAFLYLAIASRSASAVAQRRVLAYEDGVTSLIVPRRQDLMNARASRTTRRKTLNLTQSLFSAIAGAQIAIEARVLHDKFVHHAARLV